MTVEGEWGGEQFEPRPDKGKPRKKRRKDLPPEAAEAPIFSDEYLALRFAGEHADDLRYVAAWGKWFAWDGVRWRPDDTLYAFNLSRLICRAESRLAGGDKTADGIASARTVAAVERLARADRRIAATIDQWNRDLWLLNTPAGVVDLRTGRLRDARREDYISKVTAVAPDGDPHAEAPPNCPTWLAFINRTTGGNAELAQFLQRMVGYGLTGLTIEHALFFLYGLGGNGKSVFIKTVSGIMGDYATTADMEVFTASNSDRHPTDVADLHGARLVTAVETEEGRRWAESKIKALTGGDKVKARFMRQDFFEYMPQFKLIIAGNHKPALRGVDQGIRRRMNLIPFTVEIPESERDENLAAKLEQEWPGILQWMIDGCLDWAGEGLAAPAIVREATAEYIAEEDALGQWIAEACEEAPNKHATVAELFASWRKWADKAGEFIGSQKRFSQSLQDRGFRPRREGSAGNRGFDGIAVRIVYDERNPPPEE